MVLDAKALTWAAKNNLDTAKLKAAKVQIYGKWYFPEMPAGVPLVNLETGEQQVFAEHMVAGEVLFVPAAELVSAGLAPADFTVIDPSQAVRDTPHEMKTLAPLPLLAMARPPGLPRVVEQLSPDPDAGIEQAAAAPIGLHLPSPSIAPFVLGVGFCILMLGLITNPIILVVGVLWMVAGAIGWIRIGLLEARAAQTHATEVE